jgi:hypothetical protein
LVRSRRRRITGKQHLIEAKFLNRLVASWPVEHEDEVATRGTTSVGRPCLRDVERSEGRPRLSEDRLADPRAILVLPRDYRSIPEERLGAMRLRSRTCGAALAMLITT